MDRGKGKEFFFYPQASPQEPSILSLSHTMFTFFGARSCFFSLYPVSCVRWILVSLVCPLSYPVYVFLSVQQLLSSASGIEMGIGFF